VQFAVEKASYSGFLISAARAGRGNLSEKYIPKRLRKQIDFCGRIGSGLPVALNASLKDITDGN